MTGVTDIDLQFGSRTAGDECIATTARHGRIKIFWMDTFFHRPVLLKIKLRIPDVIIDTAWQQGPE